MIGDELVVDGGMVRFEVVEKVGPDVHCRCIDPGLLLPRANLTFWRAGHLVREGNSMLPTISSKATLITCPFAKFSKFRTVLTLSILPLYAFSIDLLSVAFSWADGAPHICVFLITCCRFFAPWMVRREIN